MIQGGGGRMEWEQGEYRVTTNKAEMDLAVIHRFLCYDSYWATGIPRETVERSIANSLAFGLYRGEEQIGFARVVTDYATFAYIADVFVLAPFRGQGLAKWLIEVIRAHPDLQGLRRWLLVTRDAHRLYEQVGFTALQSPSLHMEIKLSNVYRKG